MLCFLHYCCHSTISRSITFSPSSFSPSLPGQEKEVEGRMNSPKAAAQLDSAKAVCGVSRCVCCCWETGRGEGGEESGVQMRGSAGLCGCFTRRSTVVTVQFRVRVTADWTAPVTARGQRLSREHLFTLY